MLQQNNSGTAVPPVPEDPFQGTLKCIQYDPASASGIPGPDQTATRNALIGHAAIYDGAAPSLRKYNAVGLRATGDTTNDDNVLQLGGDSNAEYDACAQTLIVNHLFDGATDPISLAGGLPDGSGTGGINTTTSTELVLVPCGDNFLLQEPGSVVAQFLVFNEFEQRFSASRTVDCYFKSLISNIDTANNERSIFSAGVSGTIAGQTRIRGVGDAGTGRGLTGTAHLSMDDVPKAASYDIHQMGNPPSGTAPDLITIP